MVIYAAAEQFAKQSECELQQIPLTDTVEPRPDLLWESLFFALHLMDRWTLSRLGFAGRELSMGGVQSKLRERGDEEFINRLRDGFNAFQLEYEQFEKLLPAEGEHLKGTLCWEFSKNVCAQFSPDNLGSLVFLATYAAETVVFLYKCCDDLCANESLPA
jgi:hypothetical protein